MLMLFLAMLDDESDKTLFLKLHDKYSFFVFCVANKFLHDDTVAEEVASDVWVEIATHIKEYNFLDDESSKNLFYTITKNLSQTTYNKNENRIKAVSLSDELPDSAPSADSLLLSEEKQSRIIKILSGMDELARDMMILRYSAGKKPREISRLLSVSVNEVYKITKRGLKVLKKALKEDGYFE